MMGDIRDRLSAIYAKPPFIEKIDLKKITKRYSIKKKDKVHI